MSGSFIDWAQSSVNESTEGALVSQRNSNLRAYSCLRVVIADSGCCGCGLLATDDMVLVDDGVCVTTFATAGRGGVIERCWGSALLHRTDSMVGGDGISLPTILDLRCAPAGLPITLSGSISGWKLIR